MPPEMEALNALLDGRPLPTPAPSADPAPATDPAPAAPTATADPEPAPTDPNAQTPPAAPAAPAAAPAAEAEEDDLEVVLSGGKGKANAAFAQMRVENTNFRTIIRQLGETLGLPVTGDLNQTIEGIRTQIVGLQSQRNNIPAPFLQQATANEAKLAQLEADQMRTNALLAFENVKNTFKLSQAELGKFAQDLVAAGKNPMEKPMDLVQEYRFMNYEALTKKAVDEALAAERERQTKAREQSATVPTKSTPPATGSPAPINTVAGLASFLDGLGK
jgi:hypothetical protein